MQAACTAKCYQGEIAWVVSALDGDHANCFLHGRIDHAYHTRRELFHTEGRLLLLQPLRDSSVRAVEVKNKIPAQEAFWLQASEQEIGISNGWLCAAAIADRAGISAGRLRPHPQCSRGVEARNRSAARADRMYIEHRNSNRQAGNCRLNAERNLTLHQRNVS